MSTENDSTEQNGFSNGEIPILLNVSEGFHATAGPLNDPQNSDSCIRGFRDDPDNPFKSLFTQKIVSVGGEEKRVITEPFFKRSFAFNSGPGLKQVLFHLQEFEGKPMAFVIQNGTPETLKLFDGVTNPDVIPELMAENEGHCCINCNGVVVCGNPGCCWEGGTIQCCQP